MLDSWYLSSNRLIYQEDIREKKITFVQLSLDAIDTKVYQFQLPEDVVIRKTMTQSHELYILGHACDDKVLLRSLIDDKIGERPPENFLITYLDDKLVVLAEGEVIFFRPESILREEEQKETIRVSRQTLRSITGYPADHRIVALMACSQNIHRQELVTISEDTARKQIGLQIYWEE